jgi:hypothetical protein
MGGAALFTDAWLEECNAALASVPGTLPDARPLVVTELVTGAPPGAHGALTLVVDEAGARLRSGDDAAASAWLTVSMADAEALHDGSLDPAAALTQGRVRIRGDLRAVVDAVGLLAAAHQQLRARGAAQAPGAAPERA